MDLRRAAVGLQKAAQSKFGVKPNIKTGSPGDMTVSVNGKEVYGYKREGGLATDELLRRIEAVRV
jgi:predicted Rdx family selenoprotein